MNTVGIWWIVQWWELMWQGCGNHSSTIRVAAAPSVTSLFVLHLYFCISTTRPLSVCLLLNLTNYIFLQLLIPQNCRGFTLCRSTDHTPSVWQSTVTIKGVLGMFPFKSVFRSWENNLIVLVQKNDHRHHIPGYSFCNSPSLHLQDCPSFLCLCWANGHNCCYDPWTWCLFTF